MTDYGRLVKKYRAENDYSQEEIANILGVTKQAVGKWERGETVPNDDTALAIDQLLASKEKNDNPMLIFKEQSLEDRFIQFFIVEGCKRKYLLNIDEEDFLRKCFFVLYLVQGKDVTLDYLENVVMNPDGIGMQLINKAADKAKLYEKVIEDEMKHIRGWFVADYYPAYSSSRINPSPIPTFTWTNLKGVRSLVSILCRERRNIRIEDYKRIREEKSEDLAHLEVDDGVFLP